ncbi:MAG: carboxypeptidase-like regulatory domain-containing protein [Bacteroidales bacterium]
MLFIKLDLALLAFVVFILLSPHNSYAQEKVAVSGYVKDASTGEVLIGATIYVKGTTLGTSTNSYGFYSLNLPKGKYTLVYSYISYILIEKEIDVEKGIQLSVELQPESVEIGAVVISREKANANVTRPEMSVVKLDMKKIRQIPALMGEVDVIKAIQLLPGVVSAAEGSSGFSVRGGAMDHNLILLDEATVYNASHLMGFFSVFNNDAVKDVKLYKGDMPASMGGRLASVLDVRMKEGNSKEFVAAGGIGTLSSRFTLEGPIVKDKCSFIVSGRRTYIDLFFPLLNVESSSLYFYDFNAKVNYTLNENNRIFVSGYFGRDMFGSGQMGFGYGNKTFTTRWNHVFGNRLFMNATFLRSNYNYLLEADSNDANAFRWDSEMKETGLKIDFSLAANTYHNLKFGISSSYFSFSPGVVKGTNEDSFIKYWKIPENYALEHGIYMMDEYNVNKFVFKYGLRYSIFQNIGKAKSLVLDDNYNVTDYNYYKSGEIYNTYSNLEPRFGVTYLLNDQSSLKTSYAHTVQYIQQASNSQAGSPLDVWFTASPNIKPQVADQWAIGYFRNFFDNSLETSAELYYKKMNRLIDFKDFASLLLNDEMEADIRAGKGHSYGMELYARFARNNFDGWVSYTYSRTYRKTTDVNYGNTYKAAYDKPHNLSIVFTYNFSKRTSLSANWQISTGQAYSLPVYRAEYVGTIIPGYSVRNDGRFPVYHRLDLSFTVKSKHNSSRKWQGEWNFSVVNAYNRKNPWTIMFLQDKDEPTKTYAQMIYFPMIPSVTYNFKF